ncbi:hypothetical protein [Streptomyces sp. NPDC088554]|uniref:hypothetical protein n=1 Tax=Streptomyces sp. NPDC088554 TaxID=3365865 RepID=UPI0037F48D3E
MTEYRYWLVAELEAIGTPVHPVGHNWGGGHVVNAAAAPPRAAAQLGHRRHRGVRPAACRRALTRFWAALPA